MGVELWEQGEGDDQVEAGHDDGHDVGDGGKG